MGWFRSARVPNPTPHLHRPAPAAIEAAGGNGFRSYAHVRVPMSGPIDVAQVLSTYLVSEEWGRVPEVLRQSPPEKWPQNHLNDFAVS